MVAASAVKVAGRREGSGRRRADARHEGSGPRRADVGWSP